MFEWGIREGLLTTNPAKALQIKDTRRDIELREAFTQEDITLLFSPKTFTESSVKHPSFYWAPLIGLYTGMRLEEICQLHCSDIRQEQNIWYIDINTDHHDKRLKNRNAFRKIPIHNDLLAYGFIKYVDKMKLNGQERLFPELRKTEKCPKYGHMVSNFFSRYIERCGITGKKSFHSLRHTFSDFFKRLNLHTDVFRQIFGHEIPHLATRQYGSEFPVSQCYQEIISHLDVHKK
nr:site-specific integrase [Desulfovibrio piger]